MIICRIMGGLGNQMFQYALVTKLRYLGKEVKLDITFYETYNSHNGYELDKIFNIDEEVATIEEIIYALNKTVIWDDPLGIVHENIYSLEEGCLSGYWTSINYFSDIKPIIKEKFTFKNELDDKNLNMLSKIQNSNSVALHVRRGDYLDEGNVQIFGCIGDKYYTNAIKLMEEKISNPTFFIFSNDMEWCKNNITTNSEIIYVELNKGKDSYKDMQLMSRCKNYILANSSFSWWAAWLNENLDKIVIIPDKFAILPQIPENGLDIYCEGYIRM